ncbi:helix-turn-helix domain-containing protein [Micromonospora sp. NPDC049366]|uniref:helix-turn-helix domain-containing protein n=1 Tax=Micromonospora sp. NPDC049366 TaxID=3364271 RepID=UPI00378FCB1F
MTERRGAAYQLWLRVEEYLSNNIEVTKTELARRTRLSRPTIDRLRDGRRPPERATVRAIADAIDLDYDEALQLAGYPGPVIDGVDVRRVILSDPMLEPEQAQALLQAYAAFQALNAQTRGQQPNAATGQGYGHDVAGEPRQPLPDDAERRQAG